MTAARQTRLRTSRDLASAIAELADACPIMTAVHRDVGIPSLRNYSADFSGLVRIVIGQQLSAASAGAIWRRFTENFETVDAKSIASSSDARLKSNGLSDAKIRTVRAVSQAVLKGELNFARLNRTPDDDIRTSLVALHGIGPWTADVYLLFALHRPDVFPAADLALMIAVERRLGLARRPSAKEIISIAERWRPWRAAAALLLWADYQRMLDERRSNTPQRLKLSGRING